MSLKMPSLSQSFFQMQIQSVGNTINKESSASEAITSTRIYFTVAIQRELIYGLLSPLRIIKTRTALERQKYETLHIHLYDISAFTSECGIILPLEDAIGRTKQYQTLFKRDYE